MAKITYSKAFNKYGASMGRTNQRLDGKCYLRLVPLDSGGYDPGGAYWGFGSPLYVAQSSDGNQAFVRASHREDAKQQFLEDCFHDNLSFYR